uniref:Uncharacterized protein n=1 Tax=uncultured Spirochaetaceae bacterium TaxID=201186 RepID=A0A650EPL9_9SPIO|nr:hypothetical protein Unknown280_2280 [uncultured Spirochaetaceae bacterium]
MPEKPPGKSSPTETNETMFTEKITAARKISKMRLKSEGVGIIVVICDIIVLP